MKHHRAGDGERILAVFIDFENLALGFGGRRDRFQIEKVLERLVEKGKIVAKKAYADWSRFGGYAGSLHEAAIELIEIPKRSLTGKNSADIRLVVDAIDLAYSKDHIDTFVIVSGDSDFSPLVSKLKELGKHVIGLGLVEATSNLLRDNCDEFIYYEDLDRPAIAPLSDSEMFPEGKRKVFALLLDSLLALRRENKEQIFSSMVKDTMKRKKPSFNEEYHGYRTFSELLEDAQRFGLIEIEKHKSSGTYVVLRFGGEIRSAIPTILPTPQPLAIPGSRGRHQQEPRHQLDSPPQRHQLDAPRQQPGRPPLVQPDFDRRDDDRPPLPGPSITRPQQNPPPAQPQLFRPAAQQPQPPVRPTTPPASQPAVSSPSRMARSQDVQEEVERPNLGRSLIDEVDIFDDDIDEIPSYAPGGAARTPTRPGTSAAKPAATPAKKVAEKSKVAVKSAVKPQAAKPAAAAAEPAKKPRAAAKPRDANGSASPTPESAAPAKKARQTTPGRGTRSKEEPTDTTVVAPPPRQAPAPEVAPRALQPAPVSPPPPVANKLPANEEDSFGAGLDD